MLPDCSHDEQRVFEQNFYIEVIFGGSDRRRHSSKDEVDIALPQIAVLERKRGCLPDVESKFWKLSGEPIDHGRHQPCGHGLGASDANFSGSRIGKELDFPDRLPQIVEDRDGPSQQCRAIERWYDSLNAALEKLHTERVFHFRNRLGDGRLGHGQFRGGLSHAAAFGDRHQNTQLPQLEPPQDAFVELIGADHEQKL